MGSPRAIAIQALGHRTKTLNVTLVDMTGAAVPLGAAFSHREPLLVQFIFTTCSTICPVMSGLFAAVQDQCRAG